MDWDIEQPTLKEFATTFNDYVNEKSDVYKRDQTIKEKFDSDKKIESWANENDIKLINNISVSVVDSIMFFIYKYI